LAKGSRWNHRHCRSSRSSTKEATFVSISWSFSPRELKLYMLMSWQVFIAPERVFRQSISVATSCTEFVT
jgi:hypothetical protein